MRQFTEKDRIELLKKMEQSEKGRERICYHQSHEDLVQDMIIAMNSKSYVCPHSHPSDRQETYHIIEGCLSVYFFDENGVVKNKVELNKSNPYLKIYGEEIHFPVVETGDYCIYHEILTGPFEKNNVVNYAKWAPLEDKADLQSFLKSLR